MRGAAGGGPWGVGWRVGGVVAVLAALPYLSTVGFPFLWHDHAWLENNPQLLLSDVWGYLSQGSNAYAQVGPSGAYEPLAWLLYALQAELSRGAENPALFFRLTSLLLHGVTAGLLAWWVARLGRGSTVWVPAMAGLVFAWAPLQAAVVCMPWAQPLIVSAFLLVSGGLMMTATAPMMRVAGGLVAGLATLAHGASWPLALALPMGVAWLDDARGRRAWRAPAVAAWVTVGLGLVAGWRVVGGGLRAVGGDFSGLQALAILAFTATQPAPSSLRPFLPGQLLPSLLGLGLALGVMVCAWRCRGRQAGPLMGVGLGWMALGALGAGMAMGEPGLLPDRLTYLAALGWAVIVSGGGLAMHAALRGASGWLLPSGAVAIVSLFLGITVVEMPRFVSDEALFGREHLMWPASGQTSSLLGMAHAKAGDTGLAMGMLEAARQAEPERVDLVKELFLVYLQRGREDKARSLLKEGLMLAPEDEDLKRHASFWLEDE